MHATFCHIRENNQLLLTKKYQIHATFCNIRENDRLLLTKKRSNSCNILLHFIDISMFCFKSISHDVIYRSESFLNVLIVQWVEPNLVVQATVIIKMRHFGVERVSVPCSGLQQLKYHTFCAECQLFSSICQHLCATNRSSKLRSAG